MPRTARISPGGMVYHAINRGVGKQQLFFNDDDYLAFECVNVETLEKRAMRILSYCLMPNNTGILSFGRRTMEILADSCSG